MSDVIPILDLTEQYRDLKSEIQAAVNGVLESGKFILGPEVQLFEQEAASYLGVKHAIGVNSGTDALVIAMRALGICPGDEVITTPFSFLRQLNQSPPLVPSPFLSTSSPRPSISIQAKSQTRLPLRRKPLCRCIFTATRLQ